MTVEGEAVLTPCGEKALRYREDGRMRLPGGAELDAHAAYVFAVEGDRLTLLFPEAPSRLFQAFALRPQGVALVGESLHACPPDLYRSAIAFEPDGGWSLRHAVSGPRKAYVSTTRYRHAG